MNKHTPKPWAVHPMATMAVHQPELECWIPQSKADVCLIAAAPDLLDALEDLLKVTGIHGVYAEKARAAIAKARGEK
jgi:hypothetical protein